MELEGFIVFTIDPFVEVNRLGAVFSLFFLSPYTD
jgi:hypothetical protein